VRFAVFSLLPTSPELSRGRRRRWNAIVDPILTLSPLFPYSTHLGCVPIGEAGDYGGWYWSVNFSEPLPHAFEFRSARAIFHVSLKLTFLPRRSLLTAARVTDLTTVRPAFLSLSHSLRTKLTFSSFADISGSVSSPAPSPLLLPRRHSAITSPHHHLCLSLRFDLHAAFSLFWRSKGDAVDGSTERMRWMEEGEEGTDVTAAVLSAQQRHRLTVSKQECSGMSTDRFPLPFLADVLAEDPHLSTSVRRLHFPFFPSHADFPFTPPLFPRLQRSRSTSSRTVERRSSSSVERAVMDEQAGEGVSVPGTCRFLAAGEVVAKRGLFSFLYLDLIYVASVRESVCCSPSSRMCALRKQQQQQEKQRLTTSTVPASKVNLLPFALLTTTSHSMR
jgi:hypothetical protein